MSLEYDGSGDSQGFEYSEEVGGGGHLNRYAPYLCDTQLLAIFKSISG
jgi:hypothetical protein